MRLVYAYVLLCCALVGAPKSEGVTESFSSPNSRITLLMQFDGDRSEAAIQAMKAELESILSQAGLTFDYRLRSELDQNEPLGNLLVVRFKGQCVMSSLPALFDELGPYAITHVSDGEVLPFSEVACDRVRVSIQSAMSADQRKQKDWVLGRALGRVLAHEVYHALAKTKHHGTSGVARTSLSREELLSPRLDMHPLELAKLRKSTL